MKRIITDLEGVLRSPLPLLPPCAALPPPPAASSEEEAAAAEAVVVAAPSLTELACVSLRKVCTNLLLSPHTDATNGKCVQYHSF